MIPTTTRRRVFFLVSLCGAWLAAAHLWPAVATAQSTSATGVIAGSVSADRGEVRAFRVKARDTVHRVSYTVYTVAGRYQIFNLPPSTYDVQVLEEGFESPVETVSVLADQTSTLDLV